MISIVPSPLAPSPGPDATRSHPRTGPAAPALANRISGPFSGRWALVNTYSTIRACSHPPCAAGGMCPSAPLRALLLVLAACGVCCGGTADADYAAVVSTLPHPPGQMPNDIDYDLPARDDGNETLLERGRRATPAPTPPPTTTPAPTDCNQVPPCKNGGTCTDADGTDNGVFSCACVPGWEGQVCSTQTDLCVPVSPCKNGAECISDIVNDYTCTCLTGFSGKNCQTDTNDCSPQPCNNGGTCTDLLGGFSCACASGFFGATCESNVDRCVTSPCQNGGTCVTTASSFRCDCVAGFQDANCQTNINDCAANPCLNGGACVDGVNAFSCNCAGGFEGTTCSVDINECASNPCQNGGSCADGTNQFVCTCAAGWQGPTCSQNVDECASGPCQNGGTCQDKINGFACDCREGTEGTFCQDTCATTPCCHRITQYTFTAELTVRFNSVFFQRPVCSAPPIFSALG